jgi:outer membrane protein assembly factor BamE (lipoprotein component of BamABCDE complex)
MKHKANQIGITTGIVTLMCGLLLTMQEVVAVMGRPTVAPTEIGGQTMLDYLPRGETSLFKKSGGSAVENLTLTFDSTGKLEKIKRW